MGDLIIMGVENPTADAVCDATMLKNDKMPGKKTSLRKNIQQVCEPKFTPKNIYGILQAICKHKEKLLPTAN